MKNIPSPPSLPEGVYFTDSHCHLDMEAYQKNLDQIVEQSHAQGVHRIITIGIDVPSSQAAIDIAQRFPQVFATVGIHPHAAASATTTALDTLAGLAKNKNVVGFGEIGLDYVKNYAPQDIQHKAFIMQLQLAKELDLPLIIHDREAHDDTLASLQRIAPFPQGGVLHCFSGDMHLAEKVLDLGFYISIPGVVTFKNAAVLQEVVREVPLERMLIETDGPFLTPVPFRGKQNMPEYIQYTALKIAELKGLSLAEVAEQTSKNTQQLFHLPVY